MKEILLSYFSFCPSGFSLKMLRKLVIWYKYQKIKIEKVTVSTNKKFQVVLQRGTYFDIKKISEYTQMFIVYKI